MTQILLEVTVCLDLARNLLSKDLDVFIQAFWKILGEFKAAVNKRIL